MPGVLDSNGCPFANKWTWTHTVGLGFNRDHTLALRPSNWALMIHGLGLAPDFKSKKSKVFHVPFLKLRSLGKRGAGQEGASITSNYEMLILVKSRADIGHTPQRTREFTVESSDNHGSPLFSLQPPSHLIRVIGV
jgi:hypothetical protein